MPPRKRHLAWQAAPPIMRAACGLRYPSHWTHDPAEVTCLACIKTMRMAEAEIKQHIGK